jgi:hypothetical protein
MLKLIVHIGAGKCGSSAIQEYLKLNAPALRARGVLVPGGDLAPGDPVLGSQIAFFNQLLSDTEAAHISHQPTRADATTIVMSRLSVLRDEMQRDRLHTMILSAENLSNEAAFSHLLAHAKALFDIHIVAYIRRQDEYLSSSWGQWYCKMYPNIDAYLTARMPQDGDWYTMLSPWLEDFGAQRMHVRRYGRAYLHNGDVVDDFFKLMQLPVDATDQKVGSINESNHESLIALAHRVQDCFTSVHDTTFYHVMNEALGETHRPPKTKPYLFDFPKRTEIMLAYAESNERVRATYFPELAQGTPLFAPPSRENTQSLSAIEQLGLEVSMLTRVVYAMATQFNQATAVLKDATTTRTISILAVPNSAVLKRNLSSAWYAEQNPDIEEGGYDPYWHWCNYGVHEGRLPAQDVARLAVELMAERNSVGTAQ